MKIFMDDVRPLPEGFDMLARNTGLVFLMIRTLGASIDVLSLDHDMGDGDKSGYDVLKFLEELAYEDLFHKIPKAIIIHSANPVGRKNMEAAIRNIELLRGAHETKH